MKIYQYVVAAVAGIALLGLAVAGRSASTFLLMIVATALNLFRGFLLLYEKTYFDRE